jgi:molybdate transport system substrate-binding protein
VITALITLAGLVTPVRAETLRVFAAASLTEAFGDLARLFGELHPGATVEFQFAGSQLLRTQLEQGASADLFASADTAQMNPLARAKLVGPSTVFAHNALAVVASSRSKRVQSLGDLAKPRVRIVVAGATVPVGRYTAQVMAKISAAGIYGHDFQPRVTANIRSEETNVRSVLSKVGLGEADAGFVYRTDVRDAEGVTILEIPAAVNVVAVYPMAVVQRSARKQLATSFQELVTSERGRAVLASHGFRP